MHGVGADLDLQRLALGPQHRGVEALVHVGLGHGDHVLEAPGQRLPERVDDAHRPVAVLHRVDHHAHRGEVVDLVELLALAGHLLVDRVEVLRPPDDLDAGDAHRLELAAEDAPGLLDERLAVGPALVDHLLDLAVAPRVQGREGEVLELPLEGVDAEPVRERRVDLERLLGLLDLLRLGHVRERAHVVQPVRELDDQHADVARHRDDQLAVVLGLVLLLAVEVDLRQLGDAVNQRGDLAAEEALDVVEAGAGVLDGVVHQGGGDRGAVEPEPGADARAAEGVGDERLARVADLRAVPVVGEHVGAPDHVPVHVRVVLGHLSDELLELRIDRLEREPDVREVLRHATRIPRPAGGPVGPPAATRIAASWRRAASPAPAGGRSRRSCTTGCRRPARSSASSR